MKRCRVCGDPRIVIISETRFGQGDSETGTYCKCESCDNKTDIIQEYGFPASVKAIREVQSIYEKNNQ